MPHAMRIEQFASRLAVKRVEDLVLPVCWRSYKRSLIIPRRSRYWITTRAQPISRKLPSSLEGLEARSATPSITKKKPLSQLELRAVQRLDVLLEDSQETLQKEVVPTEDTVLEALKTCRKLSEYFKSIKEQPALSTIKPGGEAGNLLFLEADPANTQTALSQKLTPIAVGRMASSIAEEAMDKIAETVKRIAEDKNVFITSKVLQEFVDILSLLNRPESLAYIFILYASKSRPQPDTRPLEYTKPNRDWITAAIPLTVAKKALDAAIKVQNLPLCLDIIEHSVSTKAYKRAKIVRKASLPAAAVVMTPGAAYILASRLAEMQEHMSTSLMTTVGTAGIITYVAVTGTLGFIAKVTANSHMERVTWAGGIQLRQRWLREDERAFTDKIACAWGFADPRRRGEEEGPEWEALKELCGVRGMMLDRVEFMEGMQ